MYLKLYKELWLEIVANLSYFELNTLSQCCHQSYALVSKQMLLKYPSLGIKLLYKPVLAFKELLKDNPMFHSTRSYPIIKQIHLDNLHRLLHTEHWGNIDKNLKSVDYLGVKIQRISGLDSNRMTLNYVLYLYHGHTIIKFNYTCDSVELGFELVLEAFDIFMEHLHQTPLNKLYC